MKYSIITFGCRVNQADSLRLEEDLRVRGATESASGDADLIIVNTCSVTATADQGARQTIRRIARENPRAQIIATGCYATRCPDEVAALPGVVRIVRNDDKADFFRASGVAPRMTDLHLHLGMRTSGASEPRERSGVGVPASERVGEFEGRSASNQR